MTSTMILDQRRARAVQEALEVLEGILPTERLMEAKMDPLLQPEYAVPILVAEIAQALRRYETALNHVVTHYEGSIDVEIAALRERVEELEKALAEKSAAKKKGSKK